jgi:hypothetical protein
MSMSEKAEKRDLVRGSIRKVLKTYLRVYSNSMNLQESWRTRRVSTCRPPDRILVSSRATEGFSATLSTTFITWLLCSLSSGAGATSPGTNVHIYSVSGKRFVTCQLTCFTRRIWRISSVGLPAIFVSVPRHPFCAGMLLMICQRSFIPIPQSVKARVPPLVCHLFFAEPFQRLRWTASHQIHVALVTRDPSTIHADSMSWVSRRCALVASYGPSSNGAKPRNNGLRVCNHAGLAWRL